MLFYTWQKIEGEFQRVTVLSIIQPVASLAAGSNLIAAALVEAPPQAIQSIAQLVIN
jgi:hypothetical protein